MTAPAGTSAATAHPAQRLLAAGARRHAGPGFDLYELPGFLAPDDCAWLIAAIDSDRSPSAIFANRRDPDSAFRTSETCWMNHDDPHIARLYEAICGALGLDPSHGERMQGQRYEAGQYFRPHCDGFDPSMPYWPMEQRRGGQRSWTAMIYLDTPTAGGDTHFPLAGIRIAPAAGTLLAWDNRGAHGAPNPSSLHEGCPVEAGTKHIVTQWFRVGPCRKPGLVPALKRAAFRVLGRLRRKSPARA